MLFSKTRSALHISSLFISPASRVSEGVNRPLPPSNPYEPYRPVKIAINRLALARFSKFQFSSRDSVESNGFPSKGAEAWITCTKSGKQVYEPFFAQRDC